jgi:nitrogen fixation NifU-like protein
MPQQLYQQMIIHHNREPVGKDKAVSFNHSADGENPSCGDELTLYIKLEQQQIEDIGFTADACAICTASASLLCQQLHGKNLTQATAMANSLADSLSNNLTARAVKPGSCQLHQSLNVLTGVTKFPSRVNCALLPWSTLNRIIEKQFDSTSL